MEAKKYSVEEIADIKERFLDGLWEYRVINGNYEGSKYITGKVVCTNEKFNSFIHNCWSKRSWKVRHINKENYIAECVYITHNTLETFDFNKGVNNWENLLLENDTKEKSVVFKYLISAIERETKNFEYWMMNRKKYHSTKTINGRKQTQYEFVDINFSSTDNLAKSSFDNAEERLVNLLVDGASIYTNHHESEFVTWNPNTKNHFMKWFFENKERVIPELWLKRYEKMVVNEVTYYGDKPYGNREREVVTGMKTADFGSTYKFVRRYAIEAYEKEFGETINMLESSRRDQIKLFDEFIQLLNDMEMDNNSHHFEINNWIIKNMKQSRVLSDLIYLNLSGIHTKNIVKGFTGTLIPANTIYEIGKLIEKKFEQLKQFDTTTKKFYKKDDEKKPQLRLIVNENFIKEESKERKEWNEKFKYYNLTPTGASFSSTREEKN